MGRDGRGVKAASSSSIQISFTYRGQACKERVKLEPTPANLKRAEQFRAAVLYAIENDTFDYAVSFPHSRNKYKFAATPGARKTLAFYLDAWLLAKRSSVKESTWVDYQKIVNHQIIPALGATYLCDLKRTDVKKWLATLDCSNKRLANIQSVLRSALTDAMMDDEIESNPLHGWVFRRKEALKEVDDVDPFTTVEQETILNGATGQVKNLLQFAFWTGMRTSELIGLNWGDVDWIAGEIQITRVKTQKSKEFEVTKTRSGTRRVKLLEPAMNALLAQKEHTFMKNLEIFQDPRYLDRWVGDQAIREIFWTRLLQKVGVRYRRPYQTRHTYASMMLSAGESPMWVAQQMGHSDWTMIARVYGKWIPDADPSAGGKALGLFWGGTNDGKKLRSV